MAPFIQPGAGGSRALSDGCAAMAALAANCTDTGPEPNIAALAHTVFPCLDARPGKLGLLGSVGVPFADAVGVAEWCRAYALEPIALFEAAWALVLRCYLSTDSVSFAVGQLVDSNALLKDPKLATCSLDLLERTSLLSIAKTARKNLSVPTLNGTSNRPFNTALLVHSESFEENGTSGFSPYGPERRHSMRGIDIVLSVESSRRDMAVSLQYTDSVLSVPSAENVAHTLAKAVQSILVDPSQSVGNLDVFTKRDWEQIHRWNPPKLKKTDACLHDLFLEHARASPEAPAICARDISMTYAELERQSSKLAQKLVSMSVGPDTLVPICIQKSGFAIVAMMAIIRAGGAFVPVDPSHPKDRLRTILQKTGKLVVASPDTAHMFEDLDVTIVAVSSFSVASLDVQNLVNLENRVRPHHPAFVLFTSGSTGVPKGIVQEHAAVCSNSAGHGPAMGMGIGETSRVFQYAVYTFDVSMMDIWTTLIHGGCVCVPSDEDRLSNLVPTLNEMRASWSFFTPSVARLLNPDDLPYLKTICLGGEALTQDILDRWACRVRFMQCYGPAEGATVVVGDAQVGDVPANIGRFFGASKGWLVHPNDHHRLVPVGAIGELLVEGPTLARGYLHDEERTSAAFIEDPAWARDGSTGPPRRMYKTGDLLRQASDGSVLFLGRKDFQLKVRGQRVEIGEVEHHLAKHPQLVLSMAMGPKSGPFERSLVGVVQLRRLPPSARPAAGGPRLVAVERLREANFDPSELAQFLRSKVPGYMVPTHWLVVEQMPLSASGKIDRKAVGSWIVSVDRSEQVLASSPYEQKDLITDRHTTALKVSEEIALIVSRGDGKLRTALEGRDFSLAAVGVDSVQAMSLSMRIRQIFDVKLAVGAVIHPAATVRSVAKRVDELRAAGRAAGMTPTFNVMAEFRRYEQDALASILQGLQRAHRVVFLTGATGFLGLHILSLLLARADIDRVIVHVRAPDVQAAQGRLTKLIKAESWWSANMLHRIETWAGDLAAPRLGLTDEQWSRLCGQAPSAQCVTDIIHNGAAVLWNADFATLKTVNVGSTVEILRATAPSRQVARLVYVSGGQHPRPQPDDEAEIAREVAASNGYAQTKFVAEMLVKAFARGGGARGRRVAVVKPGYIIGTPEQGVANDRDYLWRLAASCIDIGAYNMADAGAWLFVADVERVAGAVIEGLDGEVGSAVLDQPRVAKILDGLTVGEFWDVLRYDLGYNIVPTSEDTWMALVQSDIEKKGAVHRLWPLIETLEASRGCIGAPKGHKGITEARNVRLVTAIKKNMKYLSNAGFVTEPTSDEKSSQVETSTEQIQDHGCALGSEGDCIERRAKVTIGKRSVLEVL